MTPIIDFRSPDFLRRHILHTMSFYEGRSRDPSGGFYHFFNDDGTVCDRETRHLVGSARFAINHAMAARHFGRPEWREATRHGLRFLRDAHRDADTGGYAWRIRWHGAGGNYGERDVLDASNHCHGLALVLLAHAHALMAGIDDARLGLHETFGLMEQHFWEPAHGLYADEASADWKLAPYRGQSANLHACEAMLAAFEATGEARFLDRAQTLARSVTQRLAGLAQGLVWEHYRLDWSIDRDDHGDGTRPRCFQTGHHATWAKLLLVLDRHRASDWLLPRARELFAAATQHGWDAKHGGLFRGFGPDPAVVDHDKHASVQAEALGAAACLAVRTGEGGYWDWYDRVWEHSWTHFVDHEHGAWYRILSHDNRRPGDEKRAAGKTDADTMGACYEVLRALEG
ncbi:MULTISPECIES: AGE family epimerase/isomerase [unclassified Rhizobacter]|uniref:AGE family epimerase/isomerase n=1 Tax=unclassified Rhizobacter TaxID=2640088 RepID=UPI0006F4DD2E|nr:MULTISPECIES: AGE family epimerase/isomerase [unclassified Rhizobacter]KQU64427.1 N-acylglucosamine 2-epimerase [Rhizobacter sp. Root29]KQW11480.1 N-acylglucosamine 2-epimerase [Rhizobacter sp. Root1238]KRB19738.1 N-acylglucosamine 2-epimerase [Rhizobacter sp. Root16D2]